MLVRHRMTVDPITISPHDTLATAREKMTNGKQPTEAAVRTRVDEGGQGMPAYKDMLSDKEKDDLIAYLKTL